MSAGRKRATSCSTLRRSGRRSRLFDTEPAKRDGAPLVQALAGELINNHQVACTRCGLQYLVHDGLHACPGCGHAASHDYRVFLSEGSSVRLDRQGLQLTRQLLGGRPQVQKLYARLFLLGGVPFVCAHGHTVLHRHRTSFLLATGIHVPLLRRDRLRLNGVAEVLLY